MFHESPELSFRRFSFLLRNIFEICFAHVRIFNLSRRESPSSRNRKNCYPSPNHVHKRRRICADRKSTRLNSSHSQISYAVFCLKQKTRTSNPSERGGSPPAPRSPAGSAGACGVASWATDRARTHGSRGPCPAPPYRA